MALDHTLQRPERVHQPQWYRTRLSLVCSIGGIRSRDVRLDYAHIFWVSGLNRCHECIEARCLTNQCWSCVLWTQTDIGSVDLTEMIGFEVIASNGC